MRVGVVSDTHNNLKNVRTIVELFNAEQVDRVIHTGDISQAKTLDVLAGLHAPLFGVFGNNDQEREALQDAIERHGFVFQDPPSVNVSGGLLSKGHPLGATGIANIYEVSTHLRNEAGARQVEGAKIGLTHVIGLGSACAIHVLESAS